MKKIIFLLGSVAVCVGSYAQEAGRVLSSTPVVQQVGVPRQVCTTDQVEYQQPKSGVGSVLGALAGGALGSTSGGHGAGQAAATVIGAIGGSMLGDRIEGDGPTQVQNVQRCTTQTFFENRTVAYNVVYEYAGRQYSVQMPNDPGPSIALQISPVGANVQNNAAAPPPVFVAQQPVFTQPVITQQVYSQPQVIVRAPPVYYVPSYNPVPLSIGVGIGYWGGRGGFYGGHYRHWR
jgi:uncharacterized protein YcfJ